MRPAAAFRADPVDDLVGVGNVAGLAVDTVRRVEFESLAGTIRLVLHLVNGGRAEILARVPVLARASVVADVKVGDLQVGRLVLLVARPRTVAGAQAPPTRDKLERRVERALPEAALKSLMIVAHFPQLVVDP